MMTIKKPALGKTVRRTLAGAGALATAGLLMSAQTAYAAPYDGTDPAGTGCAGSARTVKSLSLNGGDAVLELRYSSGCRTAWARVTLRNGNRCIVNDSGCGTAEVRRNSDGRTYRCQTPSGINTSCYTAQVNDAGVTSYAYGCYDTGIRFVCGRTGSY